MKYCDGSIEEFINSDRKIVLFGAGKILHIIEAGPLSAIGNSIAYIIDNVKEGCITAFGRNIPVFKPDRLKNDRCRVLITSFAYLADMITQLNSMELSDDIECWCYAFIQNRKTEQSVIKTIEGIYDRKEVNNDLIPKELHSFWFGNDDKPDDYKRCIDSWYEKCPDYEIHEWNRNSYDCNKHPFLQKAVECGAWAYATDYARLDVISHNGGIYLDMDIEIVKRPDVLLKFDSFFGFFDQGAIDLATFGSKPGNTVVEDILKLYDDVDIPDTREGFNAFFQPFFVADEFVKAGIDLNGCLQYVNGNLILPRTVLFPMDTIFYEQSMVTDDTIMVHHNNAGWKADGYKAEKARHTKEIYRRFLQKDPSE